MKRSFPNRTLVSKIDTSEIKHDADFCPIISRRDNSNSNSNSNSDIVEPNEFEKLIIRYRELVSEIKVVRGKLYSKGIDPEKYM
jgi:hypothetical protein